MSCLVWWDDENKISTWVCLRTSKEATENHHLFTVPWRWHAMVWIFVWIKKRWCSGSHTKKSSRSWIKLSASRKHYSTHIHHFLYVVCGSIHCLYINYSYKSQWIYNNLSSEYNGWVSLQSTLERKRNLLWCFWRKTAEKWNYHAWDIDRIFVILSLWTSVFNTAIHYAMLCFDRVYTFFNPQSLSNSGFVLCQNSTAQPKPQPYHLM